MTIASSHNKQHKDTEIGCKDIKRYTVCNLHPRSLDPFYVVSYNIEWVKRSGTYSFC